jgi:AraC family transcriptional activator of mtrCDE
LLSKPQTARAAVAMLEKPSRAWRRDEIAAAASTSRATLVRDFRSLAAMTPLDFLTELRLNLARHKLASSDRPMAEIAEVAGYQSASAFSRAFQRRFDISPGSVRRTRIE